MFDFIKEKIPDKLKRLFIFYKSVDSYETSLLPDVSYSKRESFTIWFEHFKL